MASLGRVIAATVGGIVLAVLGYVAAGLIGGAIPTNASWHAPSKGIEIFVETNGIHTGLIVPKVAAGIDWGGIARSSDIADPRYAARSHLAIGWGERAFYLGTPTWADIKLSTTIHAAIGSDDTLVHIEHVVRPTPNADQRVVILRPAEYRRLATVIRASLDGAHPSHRFGYDRHDVFYQGRGRYDAIRTCNAWTGDALRHAGVRIGVWTPFSVTVMGWF